MCQKFWFESSVVKLLWVIFVCVSLNAQASKAVKCFGISAGSGEFIFFL